MKSFKVCLAFLKKMVLFSLTKFGILKRQTNIPWPRRFHLGFWQTSKESVRTLQYSEKVFGEFQGLPQFPRKMVLYLSTKLGIIEPWTNIESLRTFDIGFWQTSKKIIGNSNIKKTFLKSSQVCLTFPEKWVFIHRAT